MTWLKFIPVQAEVTLMAVQFINVESFFLLRKFIGPQNPLLTARIAYFVILCRSAKKTWRPSLKAARKSLLSCLTQRSKTKVKACSNTGLHGLATNPSGIGTEDLRFASQTLHHGLVIQSQQGAYVVNCCSTTPLTVFGRFLTSTTGICIPKDAC